MLKKAILVLVLGVVSFSVAVQAIVIVNGSSVDLDLTIPKHRTRRLPKGNVVCVQMSISEFTVEAPGQNITMVVPVPKATDPTTMFNIDYQAGVGITYTCHKNSPTI